MKTNGSATVVPSETGLLSALSAILDDSMMAEISEADYGQDADLHLSKLKRIRDEGFVSGAMKWHPREVLELIRWSDPEDPEWKPGSMGRRGHVMRAFCCAALLRVAAEPENEGYFEGENSTLAQLVLSLMVLGRAYETAGAEFLTWRIDHVANEPGARPFFRLALLLLCLRALPDLPGADIADLAAAVIFDEAATREATAPCLPPHKDQWLLGLTFFDLRHEEWRQMGELLAELAEAIDDSRARHLVSEIAAKLQDKMDRAV